MTTYFYSIGTWKLLVDMALMSSLLVLCFRFLKAPTSLKVSRKLHELEGTLKALIKEAESSGRGLNDQLASRHSELKKLLYELDSVEQRIQHSISTAQSLQQKGSQPREATPARREEHAPSPRRRIEVEEQAPDPIIEYIYEPVETPPAPTFQEALALKPQIQQQSAEPIFQLQQPIQEAIQQQAPQQRVLEEAPLQQPIRPRQQVARRGQQRPETEPEAAPIQQDASAVKSQPLSAQRQRQPAAQAPQQGEQRPLSRRLIPEQISGAPEHPLQQRVVQTAAPAQARPAPQPVTQKSYDSEVANVYSAAEQLLKAGMDLETVSRETRLPMEQIRLLSQLVGQSDLSKVQPNGI